MTRSLSAQIRTVRELAERMHRNEQVRGRVPHGAYQRDALRLNRVLAQCPASALGIELIDLPAVWEALENRYFAEHGQFPGHAAAASQAQTLIARVATTTPTGPAAAPALAARRDEPLARG